MEACCGAHHLGRQLKEQGYDVRLMSPEYVRPYVKAQKNDDRDAEAIAEAATRPTMRFVALKSEAQLDVQLLHRVRDRLVGQRTSLINQMRSILLERGIVVPQGRRRLLEVLAARNDVRNALSSRVWALLGDMLKQWQSLDARIAALDEEFAEMARSDPAARRLATIPGVGVLNATALVAAIGDGRTFSRGRDLAAWFGLVPRQATWRQTKAAGYHQTWEQISSQAHHPGSPVSDAIISENIDPYRSLATQFARPSTRQ
jgi:transposase